MYYSDKKNFSFCANCPVGIAKAEFEESATEELGLQNPAVLKTYSFKTFYDTILNIVDLESLPEDKQNFRTSAYINLYQAERRRVQRINDWIKRKNKPD